MIASPIVSIISPVFNGQKYIEETIRSVLDAEIGIPYEYIVLNDGSTDSSLEIIRKFENNVRVFTHDNRGESETINLGILHARGQYLLVLSADDPLLTRDLIYKAVAELNANIELVAVYPDWRIISAEGREISQVILPEYSDEIMIGENYCLPGPGVVFRREAALAIGGRRKIWKFVGDYDFWLRLSRLGKIKRLPGVLAQWRSSEGSTSVSQRGHSMALERIRVIEEFIGENNFAPDLQRLAKSNSYILAARLVFFDKSIPAKQYLIRAFIIRRSWPSQAKIHIVAYILLLPLSRIFNRIGFKLTHHRR